MNPSCTPHSTPTKSKNATFFLQKWFTKRTKSTLKTAPKTELDASVVTLVSPDNPETVPYTKLVNQSDEGQAAQKSTLISSFFNTNKVDIALLHQSTISIRKVDVVVKGKKLSLSWNISVFMERNDGLAEACEYFITAESDIQPLLRLPECYEG